RRSSRRKLFQLLLVLAIVGVELLEARSRLRTGREAQETDGVAAEQGLQVGHAKRPADLRRHLVEVLFATGLYAEHEPVRTVQDTIAHGRVGRDERRQLVD